MCKLECSRRMPLGLRSLLGRESFGPSTDKRLAGQVDGEHGVSTASANGQYSESDL